MRAFFLGINLWLYVFGMWEIASNYEKLSQEMTVSFVHLSHILDISIYYFKCINPAICLFLIYSFNCSTHFTKWKITYFRYFSQRLMIFIYYYTIINDIIWRNTFAQFFLNWEKISPRRCSFFVHISASLQANNPFLISIL